MASLPPKPVEVSPGEKEDRKYPPDDRDRLPARSMAPQPRYRGERPYENDRVYVPRGPRPGPATDSYTGRGYDSRRDDDLRRRDVGSRERDRDRDWDRDRDRDRDRAIWERERDYRDRDRGPRFGHPASDYDRNRRGFDRDRVPDRGSYPPHDRYRDSYDYTRRDPRPSSPIRRGTSYRRSSISPPRRRPISPYRGRASSRPRSRSPPPKRVKLGNHSIGTSPRSRSPSRSRSRSRSPARSARREDNSPVRKKSRLPERSRTPPQRSPPCSPPKPKREDTALTPNVTVPQLNPTPPPPDMTLDNDPAKTDNLVPIATPNQSQHRAATPVPIQPQPMADLIAIPPNPDEAPVEPNREPEKDVEKVSEGDVKMRDRSASPPKHPRVWNTQTRPAAPAVPHRRMSRSPPRGPRNHPRGIAPPTAPASFHPTEPRGMRRQYQPPVAPPAPPPASQPSPLPAPTEETQVTPSEAKTQAALPAIPAYTPRPSLTPDLDAEIARLRAHRAHLATEYTQISKGTRRALHELDTAAIDLRAAESRRRVADAQMEKARNGVLGVDAVLIDMPVV